MDRCIDESNSRVVDSGWIRVKTDVLNTIGFS